MAFALVLLLALVLKLIFGSLNSMSGLVGIFLSLALRVQKYLTKIALPVHVLRQVSFYSCNKVDDHSRPSVVFFVQLF